MSNTKTLHLPPKAAPSAADIEKYLRDHGLVVTKAPVAGDVPAITPDATLHNPVTSARPDLTRLPPPGERYSAPVQLPPRVWGNSRFLTAK